MKKFTRSVISGTTLSSFSEKKNKVQPMWITDDRTYVGTGEGIVSQLSSLFSSKRRFFCSVLLLLLAVSFSQNLYAQTNYALTATPTSSGGGGGLPPAGFGPVNFNDGVIAAGPSCNESAQPWGWVFTNGSITYTWGSAVTFTKIVFYKSDRPMTSCTVQYWNGSSFVPFFTYSGTTCTEDSITFSPVTTTILQFTNVSGSSNPNFREIQVFDPSFNTAPTFTGGSPQNLTVCLNSSADSINSLLQINDPDVGQTETWTVTSGPTHGTVTIGGTQTSTGGNVTPTGFSYTPNAGYTGSDAFTVQVSDGTATATTTINVSTVGAPTPILATNVCFGSTAIESDAIGGGTWSANNGNVTINSTSGVVTGVTAGTTVITYTTVCGTVTAPITINALPASIAGGTSAFCAGTTTLLTETTTGGTWSSSDNTKATVNGTGTVSGITAGISNITYTAPTGCIATQAVTVNLAPTAILGSLSICSGSTTILGDATGSAGTWTSGTPAVATVGSGSGLVTAGTTASTSTITYTLPDACAITAVVSVNGLPAAITGTPFNVCQGLTTTLADATTVGTWSSSNTATATVNATGVVGGVTTGTVTISYTNAAGCIATTPFTVNAIPAAITGATNICSGATTILADATTGGNWSSSTTGIASISVGTGLVTGGGNPGGTVTITYTIPATSCINTKSFTVNPIPGAITGSSNVCVGLLTSPLTESATGGAWSSSNTSLAAVGSTGIVSGITAGSLTIVYTLPAGCFTSLAFTVNPNPPAITGVMSVCVGKTTTLEDGTSGGTWSSSNTAQASVGLTSGIVTGATASTNPVITYTLPTTCIITATLTVNPLPGTFSVFGSGAYCSGGAGLHILLLGSASGNSYQLYNGATATGSPMTGAGGPLDFGAQTAAGTYTVVATNTATGCTNNMTGSAAITINASPTEYSVTGSGSYCSGGAGIVIGVSNSQTGVNYQLTNGGPIGSPVAGTGSAISFLPQTTAGTYTVIATSTVTPTSCTTTMGGSATITINPPPNVYAVTGGGGYCAGGTGVLVGLSGSDTGIHYQLFSGGPVGSPVTGTGSAISFGLHTGTATYTVVATNAATSCTANMSGSATVINNPLPSVFAVSGGGSYCTGGVTVNLSGSQTGKKYQLYNGGTPVGTAIAGTGGALTFTSVTSPGTLTILATDTVTLCTNSMSGSAVVTALTLPTVYNVTGSGAYCVGGTGEHIFLSFSNIGIQYQLYLGATPVGSYLPGAASGLDFGAQTVTGAYTVIATNPISGCTSTMSGTVTVTTNPLPAIDTVTGGGAYCAGGTGVHVGLNTSSTGISYQLYNGSATAGTPLAGTGSALDFGLHVLAGTRIVVATNTTTGCSDTMAGSAVIVVNPLPATITGTTNVCPGSTTTLADASTGGTWSSSNASIATVDPTGIVTGVATGAAYITYTLPTGCTTSTSVSVNSVPPAITGGTNICLGTTSTLSDITGGGTWASSTPSVATITLTGGAVTSVGPGTSTITYTNVSGCTTAAVVTVNLLPAGITGTFTACTGSTTTLSDTGTGIWSSGNLVVATAGALTGIVTGIVPGTATITYTAVTGCTAFAVVTVSQTPASITGTGIVCAGLTTTLNDATSGGAWSSTNTTLATVNSASGIVTGVSQGNPAILYTTPAGCTVTTTITVNPIPLPIGSASVCTGQVAALSETSTGGTWSSSNNAQATVGSVTGSVTGVSAGIPTISYTFPTGCYATTPVTVNLTPATITGVTNVCTGSTIALGETTTGGTWSSSNTNASVGSTGIVTGVNAGVDTIIYTMPSGCSNSISVTINQTPAAILGIAAVCTGSTTLLTDATTGGAWSSSSTSLATVVAGTGVVSGVSVGTPTITYTLGSCRATVVATVNQTPPAITGPASVCIGFTITLADAASGGTWSSSNTSLATVLTTSSVVTGVGQGNPNITYSMPTGCFVITTITVNPTPSAILGTATVCTGLTTSLSDGVTGGTWSSSSTSLATVSALGVVTGVAAGIPTVSYTVATGCYVTTPVTVNTSPTPVSGSSNVCLGTTNSLSDGIGLGAWVSTNTSIATVGLTSGIVGGVATGSTTITYLLPSSCLVTFPITVNVQPGAITGSSTVCTGSTTTLSDIITGGTWTSSNTALATIDPALGVVSGITSGSLTLIYTLPGGCSATWLMTVNPTPATITGSNQVCVSSTINLANTTLGGTWGSSNTLLATVGAGSGTVVVTGVAAGSDTIIYTLPAGCTAIRPITVNALPSAIGGTRAVCVNATTTLNSTPAGTWSGGNSALATVGSSTGVVGGVTAGTLTITYSLATGCFVTAPVTVNPLPAVFSLTGGGAYCAGGTGLLVGLSGSATGISYQLYSSTGTAGAAVAGTGAAISFGLHTTAGPRVAIATNTTTGCSDSMSGSALIVVNPLPPAYYVTGGGSYCAGGTGVPVGLFGSNTGISYQLYDGGSAIGSPVLGTGSAISFGSKTLSGTYTVIARDTLSTCTNTMSGSVAVTVIPLPLIHNVTGGGTYCTGGTGVVIGLNGSESGVNYQLFNGLTPGPTVSGTGGAISFGSVTAIGTYTIVASNPSTTCTVNMLGSALVTISGLPPTFPVSGGGAYCTGGSGVSISMSGSTTTVNYQLFVGLLPTSGIYTGTGSLINFGLFTVPGTYSVVATSTITGCTSTMAGPAVSVNPLPAVFVFSGSGSYCAGGTGLTATLSGSVIGVTYNLLLGGTLLGSLPGTGSPLTTPLLTTAGVYTATATTTLTACTSTMSGSVTIAVNPLPTQYTVTGGGSYCAGTGGLHIGLNNSDLTATYQLLLGGSPIGSVLTGTGGALDFGPQIAAGTYTVRATNSATMCTSTTTSSQTITISALPLLYTVTGGGSLCSGATGVAVGLSGSNTGISYQLYNGLAPAGAAVAGTGSAISFGLHTLPGIRTVIATNTTTGCTNTMTGSVLVTVISLPASHNVTGGGSYCAGGTGIHIGLNGSESGNTYQLYIGATAIGTAVTSTIGGPLDLGAQTVAGTYTIVATNPALCTSTMAGTATISINPLPGVFNVTGGGAYCAGGAGVHVGLNGSASGISYQLVISGINVGLPLTGTGSSLDFGLQTVAGAYTITATNITTLCTSNMSGSVSVTISTPPAVYTVMGGGNYCAGGTGVDISLSGSNTGISYQLFNGAVASGGAVAGTGAAIDFGSRTAAGTYTVIATNTTSACTSNMASSATVTINILPIAHTVTGGGSYCPGGAGADIQLNGSHTGINYQLYNGGLLIGAPLAGTGSAIDFGLQPASGSAYTVVATNTTTGCTSNMTGGATVSVYPAPTVYTTTGGGSYCAGTPGVDILLSGSDIGTNYQLYNGVSTVGSPVAGSGFALDFASETVAGTYTIVAVNATTSCTANMSGSAPVTIIPLPVVFNVAGGGGYCTGGTGADVTLSGSASGVSYQLYRGMSALGSPIAGTGGTIDFGLQTVIGTYTVVASNVTAGCQSTMSGSASISINPLPTVYNVTGGGNYCAGGAGVHIGLSGSDIGIHYQLYNDMIAVGSAVAGTGSSLDFGVITAAGTYTVVATNTGTTCTNNMNGSATITINPLPTVYSVTGSGSYCAGGAGLHVYLSASDTGINYQLFNGISSLGGPVAGTDSALDFGLQTAAGNYTVAATNAATGCSSNMADSAIISTSALPVAYTVTGGGSYCAGSVGSLISITGSATGVNYQVYYGAMPEGTPQAGTGFPLDLGFEALAGTYTVVATNTVTGCTNNMTGTISVSVNPVPAVNVVSGGGSYCAGGEGADVLLDGSGLGINYQLYNSAATVGGAIGGTGEPIDFGLQTAAGIYTVVAVNAATGCTTNMFGSAPVSIYPLPVVYTVTGGGSYCAGGAGFNVGLTSSDTGISYHLYNGSTPIGSAVTGTGAAISFGLQVAAGTYTVVATNTATGCTSTMAGSASIAIHALPSVFAVIGGGSYCAGGIGYHIGLSGSVLSIQYQLSRNDTALGSPVSGTGAALDFGIETAPGSYTIAATNTATGCTSIMTGSAAIAVYPLPTVYTVTGGGSYCAGGAGVHIGLSGSDAAVNYQLYNGITPVGTPVSGTGLGSTSIDFGLQTLPVTYTVIATNGTTSCSDNMAGSATVTITPTVAPSVSITSGAGNTLCTGATTSFSASVVNGGSEPAYTWSVGGTVTATTSTYSYAPADGDVVSLTITSNAVCPSPATATSSVTMTILPYLTPSVSIAVTPGDTICQGTEAMFTATGVNGGTAPSYQWRLNGATVVGGGTTYSLIPANGDVVLCLLNSNYQCRTDTIALSNSIGMTVESNTPPTISITVTQGEVIDGIAYTDTLTAIVTNGGFDPAYQWSVNGVDVPGATLPFFTPGSLHDNDIVSCTVVNHNACGTLPASAQSLITLSSTGVTPVVAASSDIRLVPNPNKGAFTIKGTLGTTADEEVSLEITDMLGQVVYNNKVMAHSGTIDEKIQLSNTIANGMYILTLRSGLQNVVFHMVVEQ